MKKQESGRSMVEMLGVLAIIGVLSIGGIAGYTLSMRRFRVNNALDIVNKYALTTYSACQSKMLIGAAADMDACDGAASVAFLSSGLGGLPSGVSAIATPQFTAMTASNATSSTKKESSDRVDIAVTFGATGAPDAELCKTAASITGGTVDATAAQGTTLENNCVSSTGVFTFTVYMN